MRAFYKKHMNVIINIALLAATLAIVFIAIKLIIPYFLPFLLGLILAVVMDPVVKIFLKLKMPRAAATGMAMLVTVGSLATITWFAVAKIVVELSLFIADIPFYTGVLKNLSVTLISWLQSLSQDLPPEFTHYLHMNTEKLAEILSGKLSLFANGMIKAIAALPSQLLIMVIALIATFFLSLDLLTLKSRAVSLIPQRYHQKLKIMVDDLYKSSIGFIKAQIILAAITGLVIMLGLVILRADYIVITALLGGLASPIPVLGVGAVFIPLIFFNLISGNTYFAVSLLVLFAVVVVIKHSLEPKVLGQNIGINPLSVLISLYVGYQALGVYGFILGPFVLIIYNTLLKAKAFAWVFKNEGTDPD